MDKIEDIPHIKGKKKQECPRCKMDELELRFTYLGDFMFGKCLFCGYIDKNIIRLIKNG